MENPPAATILADPKGQHYAFDFQGIRLDPYRIINIYQIKHPCHQHAIKKLLRAGNKPSNPLEKEIDEVILTLQRWKLMMEEERHYRKSNASGLHA